MTEIVGDGAIGLGLKAMIHILAAKDKGIDMKSFGTLLDEPPTGLIHKKSANINKFSDIQGKKVGTQPLHIPTTTSTPLPFTAPLISSASIPTASIPTASIPTASIPTTPTPPTPYRSGTSATSAR